MRKKLRKAFKELKFKINIMRAKTYFSLDATTEQTTIFSFKKFNNHIYLIDQKTIKNNVTPSIKSKEFTFNIKRNKNGELEHDIKDKNLIRMKVKYD